jgi:hypothetical protein
MNDSSKDTVIGDVRWLTSLTGWSHDKVARLCRQRVIKGAFKAVPGRRGDAWNFKKQKTLAWLDGLEAR